MPTSIKDKDASTSSSPAQRQQDVTGSITPTRDVDNNVKSETPRSSRKKKKNTPGVSSQQQSPSVSRSQTPSSSPSSSPMSSPSLRRRLKGSKLKQEARARSVSVPQPPKSGSLDEIVAQLNATSHMLQKKLASNEPGAATNGLEVMKELMRQAIVSQQDAEERCTRAERQAREVQNTFDQQKNEWIKMNTELRDHIERLLTASKTGRRAKRAKDKEVGGLEEAQIQAQEQASLLRAVIAPMENEIALLKKNLVSARTSSSRDRNVLFDTIRETEAGKAFAQERRLKADLELQLHVQITQNKVLLGDCENLKIALEREKSVLAETKLNSSMSQTQFFKLQQQQDDRIKHLESQLTTLRESIVTEVNKGQDQNNDTPAESTALQKDEPDKIKSLVATIESLSSQLKLEQSTNRERNSAFDQLREVIEKERSEDRAKNAEQWHIQRDQYNSEIKSLKADLEGGKKRIESFQATVKDLNEKALQPCEYCADYEYKVVSMQEQVKQAALEVREIESESDAEIKQVQSKLNDQAKAHARMLQLSLSKLEKKMKVEFDSQYLSLDEQSSANLMVIQEALTNMEMSTQALDKRATDLAKASEAQRKAYERQITDLKDKLNRSEQQLEAIQHECAKTGVTIRDLVDTVEAHKLANAQNVAVMNALQEELKNSPATTTPVVSTPAKTPARLTDESISELTASSPMTPNAPSTIAAVSDVVTPPNAVIISTPSTSVNTVNKLRRINKRTKQDFSLVSRTNTNLISLARFLQYDLDLERGASHLITPMDPNTVSKCSQCREDFSGLRTKTSCRHCGNVFCWDCAYKVVTQGTASVRVCERCYAGLSAGNTVLRLSEEEQTMRKVLLRPRSHTLD